MVGTPPLTPRAAAAAADKERAEAAEAERLKRQGLRDEALAKAAEAEKEAAAAAKEMDSLAARQREALRRAAEARKTAALHAPDGIPDDDHSDVSNNDGDTLRGAMLQHEAAAVINLHAQAVGVQNIRSLVHHVLDLATGNYTRWQDQFLLVLGKYSLEDHVLDDSPAPDFPDWVRMDCVVKSWIAGTISTELVEIVMEGNSTARAVWLALETQFLGTRKPDHLNITKVMFTQK
ncbi:unnamed protein product [Urochloa humidicola]